MTRTETENAVVRVVVYKPDALYGEASHTDGKRAVGLLLALARHCGASSSLPDGVVDGADRAARQLWERAESEPSFSGSIDGRATCAARLLTLAEVMPTDAQLRTVEAASLALRGLGFEIIRTVQHLCSERDIDSIYQDLTLDNYERVRPKLVEYLCGQTVQVCWLAGNQHPCALQHWKTYVRHIFLVRNTDGAHLLRNLVHVCEGVDARYLTKLLAPTITD